MTQYLTILWSARSETKSADELFDIHEHETLKDAVMYLIDNGAKYENKKIVKEVDWLPDGSQPQPVATKVNSEAPVTRADIPPSVEPPAVMDFSKPSLINQTEGKKNIFDGIIPPQFMPQVMGDDD